MNIYAPITDTRHPRDCSEGHGSAPESRPFDAQANGPGSHDDMIRVRRPTDAALAKRPMTLEWFDDAAREALEDSAHPLIDGLLDEQAFSVIYGASNAGKSFVALDMAFAVSTGREFNGMQTERGLVIYVAAEGGQRIRRRIAALRTQFVGPDDPKPLFALIRYPIDLRSSQADLAELVGIARAAAEDIGATAVWIIIDTLSRAMAGGDENSAVDMGRVVTAADRIRSELQCHFTFVHHSGKDQARGARGHSLLRAAADTEIEIEPGKAIVTKQRDLGSSWTAGFRLFDVDLGQDFNGSPIKSAVVEWLGEAARATRDESTKARIPRANRLLFDVLAQAIGEAGEYFKPYPDGPTIHGVAEAVVRARYYERMADTPIAGEDPKQTANTRRRNFRRAVDRTLNDRTVAAADWNGERFLWVP